MLEQMSLHDEVSILTLRLCHLVSCASKLFCDIIPGTASVLSDLLFVISFLSLIGTVKCKPLSCGTNTADAV